MRGAKKAWQVWYWPNNCLLLINGLTQNLRACLLLWCHKARIAPNSSSSSANFLLIIARCRAGIKRAMLILEGQEDQVTKVAGNYPHKWIFLSTRGLQDICIQTLNGCQHSASRNTPLAARLQVWNFFLYYSTTRRRMVCIWMPTSCRSLGVWLQRSWRLNRVYAHTSHCPLGTTKQMSNYYILMQIKC